MGVTSDVCEPYKSLCMTPVDEVSLVVWMVLLSEMLFT